MNKRIYLDTCVIIDFLLGRDSSAYELIMRAVDCMYFAIISDLVLEELKFQKYLREAQIFISLLKNANKIRICKYSQKEVEDAKKLAENYETHRNDALHKLLAKRENVDYLVTKNVKDFVCFTDIIIKKPREL
ncbi:type II toxin-antitoxin system VapC family toxin [Candidatus Woesearchaeota archaeon]|nr:type II toxin-antitoxin system VapC family toxin [Candidatus Woesearchaeota archaeon]